MREAQFKTIFDCDQCGFETEVFTATGQLPVPQGWFEVRSYYPNHREWMFCGEDCMAEWFARDRVQRDADYRERLIKRHQKAKANRRIMI